LSKLPKGKAWDSLVIQYRTMDTFNLECNAQIYGYKDANSFRRAMRKRGIKRQSVFRMHDVEQPIRVTTDYKLADSATWEDHLSAIKQMDNITAIHQKTPQEITIHYDTDKPICLIFSADWQLGQFGVDYDAFERDMDTIANTPRVYVDIGGDITQNIIQAAKMGSSHNQTPIPVQLGLAHLTIEKLKNKINTLKTGNHDYWTTMLTGEDWLGETARRLKVIYTKHGARINLQVGNQTYPYESRHIGRYNSSFNPTHSNKQEQRINYPWARFTVFEHLHIADIEQYRYNNQECAAIRTGTYAVYDDFAQQWGYYGAHVCNPAIVLYPDRDKLVVFKDMYDAFIYLKAVTK
jgi:hypothetical protein